MKSIKMHAFALFISLFALLLVAPSPLNLFTMSDQVLLKVAYPPAGMLPVSTSPTDLDGDGQMETVRNNNGRLEILSQGSLVWSSPQEWQITQAEITDFNRDGVPEVTLLLWRDFAPWPIDAYIPHPGRIQDFHDRGDRSCHIILVGFQHGSYTELWAGSALADPLQSFTSADLDQDGNQELVALENRYDARLFESSTLTVWEWNGFGFSLLTRGPQGYFPSIVTVQTVNGQELLLAQGIFRR